MDANVAFVVMTLDVRLETDGIATEIWLDRLCELGLDCDTLVVNVEIGCDVKLGLPDASGNST